MTHIHPAGILEVQQAGGREGVIVGNGGKVESGGNVGNGENVSVAGMCIAVGVSVVGGICPQAVSRARRQSKVS
jgi:hypothetical protein